MSEPQRYTLALPDISYGMDESNKGEYVLWRDYAKLQAEVKRLTKAGDAMAVDLPPFGSVKEWNAAKEGKPSV